MGAAAVGQVVHIVRSCSSFESADDRPARVRPSTDGLPPYRAQSCLLLSGNDGGRRRCIHCQAAFMAACRSIAILVRAVPACTVVTRPTVKGSRRVTLTGTPQTSNCNGSIGHVVFPGCRWQSSSQCAGEKSPCGYYHGSKRVISSDRIGRRRIHHPGAYFPARQTRRPTRLLAVAVGSKTPMTGKQMRDPSPRQTGLWHLSVQACPPHQTDFRRPRVPFATTSRFSRLVLCAEPRRSRNRDAVFSFTDTCSLSMSVAAS